MILIDATPLQSEHRLRGVGTYTRHLADQLTRLAPEKVRFVGTTRDAQLLPAPVCERACLGRRGHRPAQVYWVYNEWFLRQAIRRARPAVFHATDFNGLITVPGVATVATLYDLTPLKEGLWHGDLSGKISDLRWWLYYRRKLRRAHHIIAISERARADAIDMLELAPERITAIPLGVDQARFAAAAHEGGPQPAPYFLFVGNRAPNKNLGRVLEAFATIAGRFPGIELVMAGAERPGDRIQLEQQTERLGVRGRVRHLGFVAEDDLPQLYARATAFLFPSIEEGFGLPVLEAMAAGTPVLTSNRGVLREVAGQAALLVDPLSAEAIGGGMSRLAGDEALRDELSRRGQRRAEDFSWEVTARRTLEVYEMLSTSCLRAST